MPGEPVLSIVVKLKDLFTNRFQKLSDTVRRSSAKMRASFFGLGRAITDVRNILRGFIFYGLMRAGKAFVQTGIQIEAIRRGFQSMAQNFGQDSNKILAAMKKASRGMLSDFELMKQANNAFLLQVAKTPEEFAQVTQAARRLGQAMGVDLKRAMDSLILGIGRQSIRWLDNIGLIVKAEDANEKYARSVGKAVSQLSQMERRKAFKAAVWEAMRKKMASLGKDVDLAANAWGELGANIENVYNLLADKLRPVLKDLATGLSQTFKEIKPSLEYIITGVAQLFNDLEEGLRRTGQSFGYLWGRLESRGRWISSRLYRQTRGRRLAQRRAAGIVSVPAPVARAGWRPQATGLHPPGEMDWTSRTWVDVVRAKYLGSAEPWRMSAEEARIYLDALYQVRDNLLVVQEAHAEGARGAAQMWESLKLAALNYKDMLGSTAQIMSDSFQQAFEAIEKTISTVFFDAMIGKMKSFKDYMRSFLTDIARMLSRLAAQMMLSGIFSALFPGPKGATNAAVARLSPARITGGGYPTHAEGGIITRPHFGLVGESGPEAIIPLKSGRVPVELKGGAGNVTVNMNITAADARSFDQMLEERKRKIEEIVKNAMRQSVDMRSTVRGLA